MSERIATTGALHCWAIIHDPDDPHSTLHGSGIFPDYDYAFWPIGITATFATKKAAKPHLARVRTHFPKAQLVHVVVCEQVKVVDGPMPTHKRSDYWRDWKFPA